MYEWPQSQICMECSNRVDVILDDSSALCEVGCTKNDGVNCPMFQQLDEDEYIDV